MSSALLESPVSTRPGEESQRNRIDLRVKPDVRRRLQAQADRLNIGITAYIMLAVSRQLEIDEASAPLHRSSSPRPRRKRD